MKKVLFFAGFYFALTILSVDAAIVDGLYESEQPVSSQSRTEREAAMGIALAEVLAKVSGQLDVTNVEAFIPVLDKAQQYVQQYRYSSRRGVATVGNPEPPEQQVVWFRFDKKGVDRILRKSNFPVWGRTRPATLVWLAIEQDGGRYMLGSDTLVDIRNVLQREARRRGIILLLPLLDLQDQTALSFADIWGDFQEAILQASTRYQAEAVLVGRMSLSRSDVWFGRWTLYEQDRKLSWLYQGPMAEDVLTAGVAGTLKSLAEKYAQVFTDDNPSRLEISVLNVGSVEDYARVAKYLTSLGQIKSVHPKQINDSSVSFELDIRGNAQGLVQTIKLGNVLEPGQLALGNTGLNGGILPVSPFEVVPKSPFDVQPTDNTFVYRLIQ